MKEELISFVKDIRIFLSFISRLAQTKPHLAKLSFNFHVPSEKFSKSVDYLCTLSNILNFRRNNS